MYSKGTNGNKVKALPDTVGWQAQMMIHMQIKINTENAMSIKIKELKRKKVEKIKRAIKCSP